MITFDTNEKASAPVAAVVTEQAIIDLMSMPPHAGVTKVLVLTVVKADFAHPGGSPNPIVGTFKTGVSNPSQAKWPCNPFLGWSHPEADFTVAPGETKSLSIYRLDAIDPTQVPTPIPWALAKSANGGYPHLTGSVINRCALSFTATNIAIFSVVLPT